MAPCRRSVLVVAAGLAGQGIALASAANAEVHRARKDRSAPRPVVDPIASAVYIDVQRRGPDALGSGMSIGAVLSPVPVAAVSLGTLACGALCQRLLAGAVRVESEEAFRPSLRSSETPTKAPKAPDSATREAEGFDLQVKVGAAVLVGLALSAAVRWGTRRRPTRTARASKAVAVTEVKQHPPEPNVTRDDVGETYGNAAAGIQAKSSGPDEEFSHEEFGNTAVDQQQGHLMDYGEPQPELEPGRAEEPVQNNSAQNVGLPAAAEPVRHSRSVPDIWETDDDEERPHVDDGLQPGNKGYVNKRKTEFEEKAEAELKPSRLSHRKTEFHRIMTEPQDGQDNDEYQEADVGEYDALDLSTRQVQAISSAGRDSQASFYRIHTEG